MRKPIPSHVPFCHKNYEIASSLYDIVSNGKVTKPWNIEQKPWDAIQNSFNEWYSKEESDSISSEWETVESFFQHLVDSAEEGESTDAEGQALAAIDSELEDNSSTQESPESILDLTEEVKDREVNELVQQTLKMLEGCDVNKLHAYKNTVDAALSSALTRRRGTSNETPDYKKFASEEANLKEFGRINEKSNLHPAMRTLALYRAINGELTTIKPIVEKAKELFIMIDDSGSMDTRHKKAIVNLAILMAKRRTKQGITVKVYSFESSLYERECDLSKSIPEMGFNGGGTDVEYSLNQLAEKISSPNASILVINDGDDAVSKDFKPVRRMCALTIGNKNQGLADASKRSGGKYYNL